MEYLSIHEISTLWNMKERKVTSLCRDGRIPGARKEGYNWLIPSDALKPLDRRTKDYEERNKQLNDKTQILYSDCGGDEKIIRYFKQKYKKEPDYLKFTPYRLCLLGAHTDHNLGKITGFAIDKGIRIVYCKKNNGIIELESLQYPKRAQWHVLQTPSIRENDWADHLRGATIALNKRYLLRYGISAVIDGELPIGGLSDSSTMVITFINALAYLNEIKLTDRELIEIVSEAERDYVKVSTGKLDQYCELYAKKNNLLYVDFSKDSYELIESPKKMKKFEIVIFFSGLDKVITSSKYNTRVDELRCAAYILKELSGMEYGKFEDTNLKDIPYDIFLKYKDKLPKNFCKRAIHWYEECNRVDLGVKAFKEGDIEKFGKLINESGESSIKNWETGSEEVIDLLNIIKSCEGVYGTRFYGSGTQGCCLAIIDPNEKNKILENVQNEYLKKYPNMVNRYAAFICHTADGIKL